MISASLSFSLLALRALSSPLRAVCRNESPQIAPFAAAPPLQPNFSAQPAKLA
jgi:hypothetical protein